MASSGLLLIVLLGLSLTSRALGVRVILDEGSEPNIEEGHHIYRTSFAHDVYWDLANAGLLNATNGPNQCKEVSRDSSELGKYIKSDFKFNPSKVTSHMVDLEYLITLEERLALHVYDNVHDIDLAAGPQVEQSMCGLHLAYMQRRVEKHLANLRNSSDFAIFRIMFSSDGPNYSFARGNTIFLGNYDACKHSRLNIMRDELSKVNQSAADYFFSTRSRLAEPSFLEKLVTSLGPLVGYLAEPRLDLLEKNQDKLQLLNMRYCVAGLRYPEWRNDTYSRRNMNLRVAICLPETCDSSSIHLYRDQIKQLIDFNIKQFFACYYLDQLYCLPDEKSELRNPFNFLDSTLFILFNLIWLSLVVLATSVSIYKTRFGIQRKGDAWRESKWWHYLSSWCLQKNFQQLMTLEKKTIVDDDSLKVGFHGDEDGNLISDERKKGRNKVNLEPMDGVKVSSAILVIASHSVMIIFANNWNPADGHKILSQTWMSTFLTIPAAVVDNFFVATGILTVVALMRMSQDQLKSKNFWPVFIVYRYVRLVPLYALVHWFVQSYFRFLGSGPKWDYATSQTGWISMCQKESLWSILLPMANFKSPARHCNHVGWYLANDIQFSLLVPVLTLIYLKSYKMGHFVILLSVILVGANHIRYYMTAILDVRSIFEPSMITLAQICEEVWEGYVLPQYRCLAFLVGIGAGHILIRYERDEIKEWPRWMLTGGKLFIAFTVYLVCFMPYLSHLVPLKDEQFVLWLGSILSGSMHGIVSIGSALFIMFLCTGHLEMFAYFCSLDFLRPLADMSLSTMLIHIPIIYYHSQSLTYLPQVTQYNLITTVIIWCIESYALSFVVYLLYEMPLRKILLKILLGLLGNPRDSKTNSDNNNKSELEVSSNGGLKRDLGKETRDARRKDV